MQMHKIGVIEIGGTHVSAAAVDITLATVLHESWVRRALSADGTATEIIDTIAGAARDAVDDPVPVWGIAIPGPFDYDRGIGDFRGVAKFSSLCGVDVRTRLADGLGVDADCLRFLNDADAFGIGEWFRGAGRGHDRLIALTLGTGVGSAFLDGGSSVVDGPTVPPNGSIHLVTHQGRPLEDTVSRRAIRAAYCDRTGVAAHEAPDVKAIAALARGGDAVARQVLEGSARALSSTVAPYCRSFAATAIVVGGAISGAWDLMAPSFVETLDEHLGGPGHVEVAVTQLGDQAALLGAAYGAAQRT